ncbi:disulfide oxidoreductase [Lentibacillus saliphilus]|uniref:disulfide oxidoreductase n=1 Tax=Lentibacillus saliphilus TaxID=2737028 RepID=UPI001C30305E|nr:disulfide oxidoreductase [Lentibacillus saliphilus]
MLKRDTLLMVIWTQALVATAGSLFYSEVMAYIPCELCWIQRIFMYPLVVIYGIAAWKKDIAHAQAGLILSSIGLLVSTWHYLTQKLPLLQQAGDACGAVPCSASYVNYFGFVTIPFLAGVAFLVIITLHVLLMKTTKEETIHEK